MTPGVTGCVQAMEAVKIICGLGEVMAGKLWTIDIRTLQTNIFSL
jgi:adenylyltransferase/sulfurtransferase